MFLYFLVGVGLWDCGQLPGTASAEGPNLPSGSTSNKLRARHAIECDNMKKWNMVNVVGANGVSECIRDIISRAMDWFKMVEGEIGSKRMDWHP